MISVLRLEVLKTSEHIVKLASHQNRIMIKYKCRGSGYHKALDNDPDFVFSFGLLYITTTSLSCVNLIIPTIIGVNNMFLGYMSMKSFRQHLLSSGFSIQLSGRIGWCPG
jgi:hypothetical protein